MFSANDIKTFLSPEWYSDVVSDAVVHAVIDAYPFSQTYYQDTDIFAALVRPAKYRLDMSLAETVSTVTADLQYTLDRFRTNGTLTVGRHFSCSNMSIHQTAVTFACNPLGNDWLAVHITKGGQIVVYNSYTTCPSNH